MNKFIKVSIEQWSDSNPDYISSSDWIKSYNEVKLPRRVTTKSAGYDIYSTSDITIPPGGQIVIPTGIKVQLDEDKALLIYPRSGLGFKYRLQLNNTVGVVDADYVECGKPIVLKLINDTRSGDTIIIHKGDAIAQGIITQYFKTDDDDATEMRSGGIGSTSK